MGEVFIVSTQHFWKLKMHFIYLGAASSSSKFFINWETLVAFVACFCFNLLLLVI